MYVLTIRQNLALAPAIRRSILCEKYTITNPSAERHSRWLNKRSNETEVFFACVRPAWFTCRIKDGWVKRYNLFHMYRKIQLNFCQVSSHK